VECARRAFAFSRAFAGFEYGAALAAAIVRMKHGGRSDLARRLGRLLAPVFRAALGDSRAIDAVIPIPLHPRKLRRRGFNQALVLARAALAATPDRPMRRASQIPVPVPRPLLERHLLLRIRHTRELGRRGPNVRRLEVAGAFRVSDPARVANKRFLLVDDVMTTGATLNECAETLMRAGASEVRVVALARAV
jgi:ComF family protein